MMAHPVVTGAVLLALIVAWVWRPRGAVAPGVWMLLAAYGAMGAWALWYGVYAPGKEPAAFAFWKPTVLYWSVAAILVVAPLRGWGYPIKAIFGTYFALSNKVWRWMNWGCAAAFAVFGGVNLLVAFTSSLGNWEGFKYSCLVNLLFLVLLRLNFVWLEILSRVAVYFYRRAKVLFS